MKALIGHTGFVGGNVDGPEFDFRYNSSNVAHLAGAECREVWCAGARAVKWWANKNPHEDRAQVASLTRVLDTVSADLFILFSTIDVYGNPVAVDETHSPEAEGLHPYGLHRLELEQYVRSRFPRHLIVRLPGLFGKGLKKNVIFDMLHGNMLDALDGDAVHQYYDLSLLRGDVATALDAGLDTLNVATEPVSVGEIASLVLGIDLPRRGSAVRYDMRTVHAGTFEASGHYLLGKDEVLDRIVSFVRRSREGLPA